MRLLRKAESGPGRFRQELLICFVLRIAYCPLRLGLLDWFDYANFFISSDGFLAGTMFGWFDR